MSKKKIIDIPFVFWTKIKGVPLDIHFASNSWSGLNLFDDLFKLYITYILQKNCQRTWVFFRMIFCSRAEFDIAVDRRARRIGGRRGERRIKQRHGRRWRCRRGHPLYARCIVHDTLGSPARKFHHEFHQQNYRGN